MSAAFIHGLLTPTGTRFISGCAFPGVVYMPNQVISEDCTMEHRNEPESSTNAHTFISTLVSRGPRTRNRYNG